MPETEPLDANELQVLISGCLDGQRSAQNKLYAYFAPRMFPVCLRYTSGREEAEEVLQEAFVRMFTHLKQYRNDGSFEGWFRRIVVNTALQRYRDKARMYPVVDMKEEVTEQFSENDTFSQIGYKVLIELVQQLPPAYRMVFNLYVFEGMKHKEIAEAMHISEGTSKSNLYDARLILQKEIMKLENVPSKKLGL